MATLQYVLHVSNSCDKLLALPLTLDAIRLAAKLLERNRSSRSGVSFSFDAFGSCGGDLWSDAKLRSESSNDALADEMTPVSSSIVGTSGSMSELSASKAFHGEMGSPSEAVRYEDLD